MRRCGWAILCLLLTIGQALQADESWLREIEISSEPERDGQTDYTVRIKPGYTHTCEAVVFECVYHQEFPWQDVKGRKYTKIHEPVFFTYRRRSAKLVNDLDAFISFRVPVSRARLKEIYGEKVFNDEHPITIDRIRIRGLQEGKAAWSFELPARGKVDVAEWLRETGGRSPAGREGVATKVPAPTHGRAA